MTAIVIPFPARPDRPTATPRAELAELAHMIAHYQRMAAATGSPTYARLVAALQAKRDAMP